MPWLEVVGWVGSAILVVSLLQTRVMRFRVLNAIASAILVVYNAALQVWPMVGLNVTLVIINLVVIWRLQRSRHDDRAYDVVQIGVDEPYLAQVIERHSADIVEFNPDPKTLLAESEHAFLVTSGDQLVGLVLSRVGEAPEEQQVLLDYVLPPYRDFTPGEFVFRSDGPFADLGAERVVASPAMAASEKYLDSIGFVQEGPRRVLYLTDQQADQEADQEAVQE